MSGPLARLALAYKGDLGRARDLGLRRRVHRLEEDVREDVQLTRLVERDLGGLERTVGRLAEHSLRKGES